MQMDNIKQLQSEKINQTEFVIQHDLFVDRHLSKFIEKELLPNLSITSEKFWLGLSSIIEKFSPVNLLLLEQRDLLQQKIDDWCNENANSEYVIEDYILQLKDMGYLVPKGKPFKIKTSNVDPEVSRTAAPQLVVPVSNARFALNACNARWGSLYDAVYGSDLIPNKGNFKQGKTYNRKRGEHVIDFSLNFLDRSIPLDSASHHDVSYYLLENNQGVGFFSAVLNDGEISYLRNQEKFLGWTQNKDKTSYLFKNNDLHIELIIDPMHPIGKISPGNISDIILESAVSIILDCEDSVAAVDSEDKVNIYRNCLELMLGTLSTEIEKSGLSFTRSLNTDRIYISKKNKEFSVKGRALMFTRNVGSHMKTDIVLNKQKETVYEGLIDAIVTVGCSIAGMNGTAKFVNSKYNSIYIVKPKLHGPEECKFFNSLLNDVEALFNLPSHTIKVGLMDEERRTSCNLKECIYELKDRIVFLNTGFLDRTGDEIHTNMKLGPVNYKEKIKEDIWYENYEKNNVRVGIECGFIGKAQIGKGMWAKPDEYKEMMDVKHNQLKSGASCAWIPSPTAATLHAIHYHDYFVRDYQEHLKKNNEEDTLRHILSPSVTSQSKLKRKFIQKELDANIQSILGYVVHWINSGIGCSKVPDINNVYLMEDRATLRISSQHVANWLLHDICSKNDVIQSMNKMAVYVDKQNENISEYTNLQLKNDMSVAMQAARELIFNGVDSPNGYTEDILHKYRKLLKKKS